MQPRVDPRLAFGSRSTGYIDGVLLNPVIMTEFENLHYGKDRKRHSSAAGAV